MNPLRIGVVGVGHMGLNHCNKLSSMNNIIFSGIFDKDRKRAEEVSGILSLNVFDSYQDLLMNVDAVVIAAPTQFHFSLIEEAVTHNKHIFVEKPIAVSTKEVNQLKKLLNNKKVVLQVGHIERFNPAIQQLNHVVNFDEIICIESKRLALSNRVIFTDVVLDLMIHDIDIVLSLVKSPISSVSAAGVCLSNNGQYDAVTALLTFENGIIATLIGSRVSHEKVRNLTITEKKRVIKTDYSTKDQFIVTTPIQKTSPYITEVINQKLTVPSVDPLMKELEHFISCIKTKKQPLVGISEGSSALEVALMIKNSLEN